LSREILTNLRSDPFLEYGRLGWVTKLIAFTKQLERDRLSWPEFSRWTFALASIRRLKATWPELDPARLANSPNARMEIGRSALGVLERHFTERELCWEELPRLWSTAHRLCGLCVQSHALAAGAYQSGVAESLCPLIGDQMVDLARTEPPRGTRASVRGEAIQKAAPGAVAGWTSVSTGGRRLLMKDAFGKGATWIVEEENASEEPQ
jgi:hypothetical protein